MDGRRGLLEGAWWAGGAALATAEAGRRGIVVDYGRWRRVTEVVAAAAGRDSGWGRGRRRGGRVGDGFWWVTKHERANVISEKKKERKKRRSKSVLGFVVDVGFLGVLWVWEWGALKLYMSMCVGMHMMDGYGECDENVRLDCGG